MDSGEKPISSYLSTIEFKNIFSQTNQIFDNRNYNLESIGDTFDLRYITPKALFQENEANHSFYLEPFQESQKDPKINKFIIQKNLQFNITKKEAEKPNFLGRKKYEEEEKKSHDKHDKFCIDNMVRKIKTNIMDYILNKLNDSLIDKELKFHRIDKQLNENIKRDYNINLLNRTVADIFYNSKMSKKYRTNIDADINKYLINKITNEQKEIDTIKLLNKKFIDVLNEIRIEEENMAIFFNKIKIKEKRLKEDRMEEYLESLKNLLLGFEKWFSDKKGRNRKANNANIKRKKKKLFFMKYN